MSDNIVGWFVRPKRHGYEVVRRDEHGHVWTPESFHTFREWAQATADRLNERDGYRVPVIDQSSAR